MTALLRLDRVSAGYGRHLVLREVSLELAEGGFVALVGDNFYPDGVSSVQDAQFRSAFEALYGPLGKPVLAVVGNDGSWRQIAREQVEIFGDDVGTVLGRAAYHEVARGFGAEGLAIASDEETGPALRRARELAAQGRPVLVNALCTPTEFRKGAISL